MLAKEHLKMVGNRKLGMPGAPLIALHPLQTLVLTIRDGGSLNFTLLRGQKKKEDLKIEIVFCFTIHLLLTPGLGNLCRECRPLGISLILSS